MALERKTFLFLYIRIDHENVTYITVAMENITDDNRNITDIPTAGVSITQESNTTYEQTTAYQIETASKKGTNSQTYNTCRIALFNTV